MPDVTAVPESKFVKLDGREFRESGMLFVINDLFMWPLGLAFGVTWDPATGVYNITINRLEPSETIEDDPNSPEALFESVQLYDRLAKWIHERMKAMEPTERESGLVRLARHRTLEKLMFDYWTALGEKK